MNRPDLPSRQSTSSRPVHALVAACAVGALLGTLAGCGGSDVDPGTGALGSTVDPTPSPTAAATTSAPVTPTTTAPRPTRTAATEGDGDAEGDNQPSTKGGGICRYVGAEEVGAVLGVALRGSAVPGETGCKFDQGGNRGMSVTILDRSAAAGGMDGAKSEATSAVEGTPQDLSGIGSAAFVVTGGMFGGPDVNAAGAVRLGNRIISVFLVQRSRLAEAKVRRLEVDLLKLVVTESP